MTTKQRNFLGSFGRKKGETEDFKCIEDNLSLSSLELSKSPEKEEHGGSKSRMNGSKSSLNASGQKLNSSGSKLNSSGSNLGGSSSKLTFTQRLKQAMTPQKKRTEKVQGLPVIEPLEDDLPEPTSPLSDTEPDDLVPARPSLLPAPSNPGLDIDRTSRSESAVRNQKKRRPIRRSNSDASKEDDVKSLGYTTEDSVVGDRAPGESTRRARSKGGVSSRPENTELPIDTGSNRSLLGVFVNSDHEDDAVPEKSPKTPRRRQRSFGGGKEKSPAGSTRSRRSVGDIEKSPAGSKSGKPRLSPEKIKKSIRSQDDGDEESHHKSVSSGRDTRSSSSGRRRISSSRSPVKTRRAPPRSKSDKSAESDVALGCDLLSNASFSTIETELSQITDSVQTADDLSGEDDVKALLGEIKRVANSTPKRRGRRRVVSPEKKRMIVSALEAGDTTGVLKSPHGSRDRQNSPQKRHGDTPRKKKILIARRVVKKHSGVPSETDSKDEARAGDLSHSHSSDQTDVHATNSVSSGKLSMNETKDEPSVSIEDEKIEDSAKKVEAVSSVPVTPRRRGRRSITPGRTNSGEDLASNRSTLESLMKRSAGAVNRRCQSVVSPHELRKKRDMDLSRKINSSPRRSIDSPSVQSDGRILKSATLSPGDSERKKRGVKTSPRRAVSPEKARHKSPEKKRSSVSEISPPLDVSDGTYTISSRGRAKERVEELKNEVSQGRKSRSRTPESRGNSSSHHRRRSRSDAPLEGAKRSPTKQEGKSPSKARKERLVSNTLGRVLDHPVTPGQRRRGRKSGVQSLVSVAAQLQIPSCGAVDNSKLSVKYKEYGEVKE